MPGVSAVVPTLGSRECLGAVVDALRRQEGVGEVIVAWDLAEAPEDQRRLATGGAVPVRFVRTGGGRGPGAARNAAAAAAAGDLIVFVDDDVIPAAGALDALARACADGRTAAAGRVVRHPDVPETLYTAFAYAGAVHLDSPRETLLRPSGFCSALAALPRAALLAAGGFDESLHIYYEDAELAWRLTRSGVSLRWCPQAAGLHLRAMDRAWFLDRCRNLGRQLRLLRGRQPDFAATLPVVPHRARPLSPVLSASWPLLKHALPLAERLPRALGLQLLKVIYASGVLSSLERPPTP